jgi:hypothetical protein
MILKMSVKGTKCEDVDLVQGPMAGACEEGQIRAVIFLAR